MRLVFMGSAEFAVPSLEALSTHFRIELVVTRVDKPSGRGLDLSVTPVKQVALKLGLPIFQPQTLRDAQTQQVIRDVCPDAIVVVAYGRILPPEVLSIPPLGCINVHGSLLPKYRGAAPIQWAIIEGESESGVSIIQMDEGIDTGPILATARTLIMENDTAYTLSGRLARLGAELLVDTLIKVAERRVVAQPQDETKASYAPILKKTDGAIDWGQTSFRIANLVRGVEPWPGAYTFTVRGLRLRVFPFLESLRMSDGVPGQVLRIDREGMVVRTGDGAVLIREVQPAGSRRMTPYELFVGRRIAVGDLLVGQVP